MHRAVSPLATTLAAFENRSRSSDHGEVEARPMNRYSVWMIGTLVTGIVVIVAINVLVDPYGLLNVVRVDGWTTPKTESQHHLRIVRAHEICSFSPDGIILGPSDATLALDPAHSGWTAERVRNVGLLGGNIHEIRRYLEHAEARHPLKQVVLALDPSAFEKTLPNWPDFDESRLGSEHSAVDACSHTLDPLLAILSIDVLNSSALTLFKNAADRPTWIETENGRFILRNEPLATREQGGTAAVFASLLQKNFHAYLSRPSFAFDDCELFGRSFDDFRDIVSVALRHRIDLRLFISPIHAYLLETRRILHLSSAYEAWLLTLVGIVAEESAKHPESAPIRIRFFGGYNEITTEEVPLLGDVTPMRWYGDPSHYRVELGNMILDEIFGVAGRAPWVPSDFGIPLSPGNLDSVLSRVREAGARYRASHAGDVVAIETIADKELDLRSRRGLQPPASFGCGARTDPPSDL